MPISSALHHGRPGLNGPGQPQTFNNRHPVTDLPRDLGSIIRYTPYGLVFNGSDRRVPTGNSGIVDPHKLRRTACSAVARHVGRPIVCSKKS
jgi:hypothetical protein